ncbi:aspartate--tRNA ligase [Myxococcota bacterium]|nr:aspartate--tRNA ligase [Myxococcota bacterium]MBU1410929.1 aspartate--tRNA ligase [Myxococcota bacterium]MBU1510379.1 aspartate--tRNA ligase [Myxococcota bacterium]
MNFPSVRERTCDCGALRAGDAGKNVTLMGWVGRRRNLGGAIFVDLRDRGGVTQITFMQDQLPELHAQAETLRAEDVICIRGQVVSRGDNASERMSTGAIEVIASELHVISRSEPVPFPIADGTSANVDTRLQYRYLDLRRPEMLRNLTVRARTARAVRDYLDANGFMEVETPYMVKYTPGGARNFLVPSRINKGQFYALAESPQIYKQLLMVAGADRYFQIARCFRDEDPRGDRQPEFTQIDLEISFADMETVLRLVEGMVVAIWEQQDKYFQCSPLPRLEWSEAMEKYGTDKPDLRFGLEHVVLNDFAAACGFTVLRDAATRGDLVKGMRVPQSAEFFSRKKLDELTEWVKRQEIGPAKGLVWLKVKSPTELTGSAAKAFTPEETAGLIVRLGAEVNDTLFIVADEPKLTHKVMDNLRREIASQMKLTTPEQFAAEWVIHFPMFEKNDQGQWVSSHHPFTHPRPEDLDLLGTERQGEVKALAYDLVVNGNEVGGGSVRIFNPEIQQKVFDALGISREDCKDKFGFLLEAFRFGVPPHAGFAAGLDRIISLLCGQDSIRDVIAFPKTVTGVDRMTTAPTPVSRAQLTELGLL